MGRAPRRTLVALAGVVLLVLVWWRQRHKDPAPPEQAVTSAPLPVPAFTAAPSDHPSSLAPGAGVRPPVIDEVVLEKSEVCEGEENLVTVRAHGADRADEPFLHALIAGQGGSSVVLRGNANPRVAAEAKVIVFGRNRLATSADVPPFTVKSCKVEHQLFLAQRGLPNRDAEIELTARVDPFGATARFEAVRYEWTFGDGATSVTGGPAETHDYSRRPQDRARSEFLVRAVAVSPAGERVAGRTTIELLNPSFESLSQKGVVKIYAELEPRFPVADARGMVSQRVRLWHPHGATVRIERVRRLALRPHAPPGVAEELPARLPPIHPGETVEAGAFTLDPNAEPTLLGAEYYVEGKTEDGWRAIGNFAIMRPPRPPSRDEHLPVADSVMTAKILRARELLGQAYVTDEDLWRLEREGRMKDLVLLPARPGARPAPPAKAGR